MATTKKKSLPPWLNKGKDDDKKHPANCTCAECKKKKPVAKKTAAKRGK